MSLSGLQREENKKLTNIKEILEYKQKLREITGKYRIDANIA